MTAGTSVPAPRGVAHDRVGGAGCAVLIAQYFPPLNVIASQRALRMARVLLERYERVYVICLDHADRDPLSLDTDYGRDVLEDPRIKVVLAEPLLRRHGHGVGGSLLQAAIGFIGSRLFCGPGVDWIPALRRALSTIPASERIAMVVASGSPFIPFVTAVRWARARGAPVILDYRDLWSRNPRAPYLGVMRRAVNRLFERPANRTATLLTTVSDGCRVVLEQDAERTPVRTLYNAPDAPYLSYYESVVGDQRRRATTHDAYRIVFTGQVYSACTFAPVLRAIKGLPSHVLASVEMHYYGGCSDAVRAEFAEFGVSKLLIDHGMVSKEESLRAMADADLLLSLIHVDRVSDDPAVTGLLTTKVYDYFLAGAPILNIGPVNAEVNHFAEKIGHRAFHTMPAEDLERIRALVLDAVTRRDVRSVDDGPLAMPDFAADFEAVLGEATSVHGIVGRAA